MKELRRRQREMAAGGGCRSEKKARVMGMAQRLDGGGRAELFRPVENSCVGMVKRGGMAWWGELTGGEGREGGDHTRRR